MPFCIAVIRRAPTPNTSATWLRMYRQQVITWSALRTISRSAAWMWDWGYLSTQPW